MGWTGVPNAGDEEGIGFIGGLRIRCGGSISAAHAGLSYLAYAKV